MLFLLNIHMDTSNIFVQLFESLSVELNLLEGMKTPNAWRYIKQRGWRTNAKNRKNVTSERKEVGKSVKDFLSMINDSTGAALHEYTNHFLRDRPTKAKIFNEQVAARNPIISNAFLVNRGHENGPEIHFITNNGIVIVTNSLTNNIVTVLFPREDQIREYYEWIGEIPSEKQISATQFFTKNKWHLLDGEVDE